MWALVNRTPFSAERTWTRDREGAHRWLVAVKATFALDARGRCAPAEEQAPVLLAPEYTGEPGKSSLRYEADLTPMKPVTDVLLNASAHAPGGRAVKRVDVSVRVGPVRKVLAVHGERVYYRGAAGMTMTSPRPFETMPIVYERAFGGVDASDPEPKRQGHDPRNPIGRGFALRPASLHERPAHNVEYPGAPEGARVAPAGFGAIAAYWSPRRELAGTYDVRWEKTRKPLLPEDYDERFVLCAPADQRPAAPLVGGEPVELTNLTPEGRLHFTLPMLRLTFQTFFGRRRVEHEGRLATVVLEPDARRVLLVWQTELAVGAREVDALDRTVVETRPTPT
jgi:hypothetical protein